MRTLRARVVQFLIDEGGPTAVEYAVMLALILMACFVIVTTFGQSISTSFNAANSSVYGS